MKPTSAPIRYAGSKGRLMNRLVSLLPHHTRYVSVFGGSGADIMNKPASRWEVWNDIDSHLHNLFAVLKDAPRRDELLGLVCMTLHSRQEFQTARRTLRDPAADPVRRAWATVVVANQSRVGTHFSRPEVQWAYFRLPGHTLTWPRLPKVLVETAVRFRGVILENRSWEKILDLYDAPTTLYYCDPPYPHGTRVGPKNLYGHEMADADHVRFLDRIRAVEGRVMVSGYDCPMYANALRGWMRYEVNSVCSLSPAGKKPVRTETVWCNFVVKGVEA